MRLFGFTIAGVPRRGHEEQAAFVWSEDDRALSVFESNEGYQAIDAVGHSVGSLDVRIEPFRVRERYSNYQFNLSASDEVGDHLFRRARRAIGSLTDDGADDDTTLHVDHESLDQAPFDIERDGEPDLNVYYIGGETVYITEGSHQGGGQYNDVVRGAAGSRALSHDSGKSLYDEIPYWQGRRITVFDWTPSRGIEVRETGRVSGSFKQDNANIRVNVDSFLIGVDALEVNTRPHRFAEDDLADVDLYTLGEQDSARWSIYSDITIDVESQTIFKPRDANGDLKPLDDISVPVQVGSEHFVHLYRRPWGEWDPVFERFDEYPFAGIMSDSDADTVMASRGREIIPIFAIWNGDATGIPANLGSVPPQPTDEFLGLPSSVTDTPEIYRFHPLALAAAFLFSTDSERPDPEKFDVLHGNWSLQMAEAFSPDSIEKAHDLINETPEYQIAYFVAGWNGQPVRIMRRIRAMLNTYGFRFSVDNNGHLTFSRTGLYDVEQFNTAVGGTVTPLASDVLEYEDGAADRATRIEAAVGRLPWRQPNSLSVSTVGDDETETVPRIARQGFNELTIDADTILDPAELQDLLISRALIQDFQMPILKVRVGDHLDTGADYTLGSYVAIGDLPLESAWIFDFDGGRVSTLKTEDIDNRWVGQIFGRRYTPASNTYELEIIFTSDRMIRWRAPSAIVVGVDHYTPEERVALETGTDSAFGMPASDASYFSVGDQVLLWNDDGTLWDTNDGEVIDVDAANGIVVVAHDWTTEPPPGLILELAHLNSGGGSDDPGYHNPGLDGELENVTRAYVYMASFSDDPRLGDENLDADEYGG